MRADYQDRTYDLLFALPPEWLAGGSSGLEDLSSTTLTLATWQPHYSGIQEHKQKAKNSQKGRNPWVFDTQ